MRKKIRTCDIIIDVIMTRASEMLFFFFFITPKTRIVNCYRVRDSSVSIKTVLVQNKNVRVRNKKNEENREIIEIKCEREILSSIDYEIQYYTL